MKLAINKLSCGLDGRPAILQAMLPGSKTSGTNRWTKVLNSLYFQWMPNPTDLVIVRDTRGAHFLAPLPVMALLSRRVVAMLNNWLLALAGRQP